MTSQLYIGCSGWNYGDSAEKGGWLNVFYPDRKTRKLNYYSQFFNTVEMDATFYNKFYQHMNQGLFIGIVKTTPSDFKVSVKVPETITHDKRLDVNKGVMVDLKTFLDKISPLKNSNKLGTIIIQLPPSFAITDSQYLQNFLRVLRKDSEIPNDNKFAVEFRNKSWNTEGTLELLQHYDTAAVLTDSPAKENLEFLSNENNITSKSTGVVIRMHGRNITQGHYWYNYLYSKEEMNPWVEKIKKIKENTDTVFVYFNNHYGGKAIVNALQFKEMLNEKSLPENEKRVLESAKKYF
ncbi:MAG TPA: DUF72 domain-containing protein [Candidatus Nitrosocosmicus sp.]|nr:DUF72 domain-containing protein [Candidatus Nitrosocosmicus sp.]